MSTGSVSPGGPVYRVLLNGTVVATASLPRTSLSELTVRDVVECAHATAGIDLSQYNYYVNGQRVRATQNLEDLRTQSVELRLTTENRSFQRKRGRTEALIVDSLRRFRGFVLAPVYTEAGGLPGAPHQETTPNPPSANAKKEPFAPTKVESPKYPVSRSLHAEDAEDEVAFPIVLGSVAKYMGPAQQLHQWTVYVRGTENQDLSEIIESVTFVLHETFQNNVRVISRPPFEVSEMGWGQFLVGIKILVRGATAPIELSHVLSFSPPKLLNHCVPPGGVPYVQAEWESLPAYDCLPLPVVNEVFDELVFLHPSPELEMKLKVTAALPRCPHRGVSVWNDIALFGKEVISARAEEDRLAAILSSLDAECTRLEATIEVARAKSCEGLLV